MNFALAFGRTLIWRPHRALAALYWYATGRKVRARNRLRLAAAQSPRAYATWIETVERNARIQQQANEVMANWAYRPFFSILIYRDPDTPVTDYEASIQSVRKQFLDRWELILVLPPDSSESIQTENRRIRLASEHADNAAMAMRIGMQIADGDYVVPLKAGDRLSELALFRYGEALQSGSQPAVLFGDEDRLDARDRRTRPWFKPEWNEEMFLAQDYISSACAIRHEFALAAADVWEDCANVATYALILQILQNQQLEVRHVPHILIHRIGAEEGDLQAQYVRAVAKHLESRNARAYPGPFGSVHVAWPLPADPPLVSIIIPTRDKVTLLSKCVDGVLKATSYPRFELIIVDNGSVEPATHRYLKAITRDPRIEVLSYAAPYNFSAINNFAASRAKGDFLCLLNNDTEVIDGDWLTQMMRQAVRPHVGAVGAKLLYADGSIQHAGVIVGLGDAAGHAHRYLSNDEPGYFNQVHIAHYASAVTAACLVVEKRKFEAVGGLDADQLAVAFNDVDLCLKLRAAGWQNVYTPQAMLIHHESKSRGKDISSKHIQRYLRELYVFQERWGTKTFADPLHNPNLNRSCEDFLIQL